MTPWRTSCAASGELLASLGAGDRHTLAGLLRTLLAPFDALPPE